MAKEEAALGVGMACSFRGPDVGPNLAEDVALAAGVVEPDLTTTVTFTCPAARDQVETGGAYALFASTLVDSDALQQVTCTVR